MKPCRSFNLSIGPMASHALAAPEASNLVGQSRSSFKLPAAHQRLHLRFYLRKTPSGSVKPLSGAVKLHIPADIPPPIARRVVHVFFTDADRHRRIALASRCAGLRLRPIRSFGG